MVEKIEEALLSVENFVTKEKYRGWDPYDALYSKRIPSWVLNNKVASIILIQLNLYLPINLRCVLGIEKNISNKSLALFSKAYYIMSGIFEKSDQDYIIKAEELLNKLLANIKRCCNSYYFPFVAPKHILSPTIEDIICITESIKTLALAFKYSSNARRKKYKVIVEILVKKLLNEFLVKTNEYAYFKYTPAEEGKIVFNVSALALEAISEACDVLGEDITNEESLEDVVSFLLKHQRSDGAWPYSIYTDRNRYYWQIDFHQGFIIDGLTAFLPYLDGELRKKTEEVLERGIDFYMNRQFTKEGYSFYRYPIKYPIDIHNQAQGIITFSKLYRVFGDEKYLDFAKKIALWTIKNMQSPEGYFYSHKWPFFVNKIPYMRWGQAWMMLALATLLEVLSK